MKRHPIYGAYLLGSFRYVSGVQEAIRHHHERFDGKGYPDGIKGNQIPIYSKIIAICDAFDAMTSNRTYMREIKNEKHALQEIVRNRGTQFDPNITDIFISLFEEGYIHLEKGLYFSELNNMNSDELSEFLIKKAIKLLPEGYDKDIAKYHLGKLHLRNFRLKKALNAFNKFMPIVKDNRTKAELYNNIASAYYYLEDFDKSLDYNNKVYKIKEAYLEKARAYRYKSMIMFNLGKSPNEILSLLSKSEKMHSIIDNKVEREKKRIINSNFSITKYNRLINFSKKIQMDNAKHYDILAFIMYNLADFEKAQQYYLKSINLKHFHSDIYGSIRSQAGIAMLYMDMNRFKDAEFNLLESMNLAENLNDKAGLRMVNNNLGRLYLYWNKPEKAKKYYQKAFKYACELNKQSYATESCRFLISNSKSKKTRDTIKKTYASLYSKKKRNSISSFIIEKKDQYSVEDLKNKYISTLKNLKSDYRILEYAKIYYMLMRFLKNNKDEEYEKYKEGIPKITDQLSDSIVRRRLNKIYDISKKISSNNRAKRV